MMDRSWINLSDRCDPQFHKGIMDFIEFVKIRRAKNTTHPCPCRRCRLHHRNLSLDDIQLHLFKNGMMQDYTLWTSHGEECVEDASSSLYTKRREHVDRRRLEESSDTYYKNANRVENMLQDAFPYCQVPFDEEFENDDLGKDAFDKYQRLLAEAQTPIYEGCPKTILETVLSAMKVKVENGWSDKSFDDHLRLTRELLPKPNHYPSSFYEVKKLLKNLGMGYKVIHVCVHGCMLYYKDFKDLDKCPICDEWRYQSEDGVGSKVPKKVIRYFPLIPRLQRLYMSPYIAKEMRWHGERKIEDGLIRHPADCEAWKDFDNKFPEFSKDVRNVRLGLATDGFNPFGATAVSHSTWPVVVMPYNLPPSLCMKKEFNILAMLISGPKSPRKCLNVFMQPLIEELNLLWETGVVTYDRCAGSSFNMRAAVLWTISDFPGLGMLGGLKCKGYKACPLCLDDIDARHLSGRMAYQGHRRWLERDHPWRQASTKFNSEVELRDAPPSMTGEEVFVAASSHEYPILSLHPDFSNVNDAKEKKCWTHLSIFYDLPYWRSLSQPYSLDVMHIEKNVFDNIFGTILGIQGKTKDDIKAREGLKILGIRKELWWNGKGSKIPQAPYTVLPDQKIEILEFLKEARYPSGYAGSLKNKVNLGEKKFNGLKTHDCHVMLQRLLPIFIRPYLPHYVIDPLISLARWFQRICCRELMVEDVTQMKKDIVIILCKLEMVFPPAFFTIMMHLLVHLPEQVLLKGPVHYNWMFPIERQLGEYKRFIRNTRYPEGCIAEQYIVHECVAYCKLYDSSVMDQPVDEGKTYSLSVYSPLVKVGTISPRKKLEASELELVHSCVLDHCEQARPYLVKHYEKYELECPNGSKKKRMNHFAKYFRNWMETLKKDKSPFYNDELHCLARMPQSHACYSQCVVNGVKFVVSERDAKMKTQNSGVMVEDGDDTYYGVIDNIIEVQYANGMPVVLFGCTWFDTNPAERGSIKRDYGLLSVDTSTKWFQDWPYCLATTARQVFYLEDLKVGESWKVVNVVSHRGTYSERALARYDDATLVSSFGLVQDPYQEDVPNDIPDNISPADMEDTRPSVRRKLILDDSHDEQLMFEVIDSDEDETMSLDDDETSEETIMFEDD